MLAGLGLTRLSALAWLAALARTVGPGLSLARLSTLSWFAALVGLTALTRTICFARFGLARLSHLARFAALSRSIGLTGAALARLAALSRALLGLVRHFCSPRHNALVGQQGNIASRSMSRIVNYRAFPMGHLLIEYYRIKELFYIYVLLFVLIVVCRQNN